MLEVDEVLEKFGYFSRQQGIMLLLCSLINLLSSMHILSNPLINFVPKYWCADGLDPGAPPPNESSCKPLYNNSTNSGTCNKYNYEVHMGFQSFVSEMNWICDEAWKLRKGNSYFLAGRLIGSLFMGYLADILGRVPIVVLTNVIAIFGNFLTIFDMNVDLFCIFRFICGFVLNSNFALIRILIVEYMRPSLRTVCLNICVDFISYLGIISTIWIVVLVGNWRRFMLLDSLPIFVMPIFFYFVPESVQWLISRKKYGQAIAALRRVAKINGRQIDDNLFKEFIDDCKLSQQNTKNTPNLLHLLRTPRLRRTFLIMLLEVMIILLFNKLVMYHIRHLKISPFVRSSLLITSILPACLAIIILQDRIGRKALALTIRLLIVLFLLLSCVLLSPAASHSTPLLLSIFVIGNIFSDLAFYSNIQYTLELIPTCVRSQTVGSIYAISYVLDIFTYYFLNMREVFLLLPEIILAIIAFLGACLCLLLPETLNRTLPSSLEDGDKLGNDEHWYTFGCTQPLENSLEE
ncbi:solute carrier family 22 member 13-like isoform X2 [Drosophila novamexicana]|uniref:solute carrier family 22 member 13-like isoform X2 n=1 Tax=Drosophila novamexicana TaxID=47314 RepID=UPI0011E5DABF|nr:solute carrier family 22 member 13-like isoform X2 [Drosophila novamexicana]